MAALGADEQQVYRGSTGADGAAESADEAPRGRAQAQKVTKREWMRNSKAVMSPRRDPTTPGARQVPFETFAVGNDV